VTRLLSVRRFSSWSLIRFPNQMTSTTRDRVML
jgi:hypothetical protein